MSLYRFATVGERVAAKKLIERILNDGHLISIHDGEEYAIERSNDVAEICKAMATTGADNLVVREGTTKEVLAQFLLIYGNDPSGYELIADYSDNAYAESLYNVTQDARCF